MATESSPLTPSEEAALNAWLGKVEDKNLKFCEDGLGTYWSANDIEREIRNGSKGGREMLQAILMVVEK